MDNLILFAHTKFSCFRHLCIIFKELGTFVPSALSNPFFPWPLKAIELFFTYFDHQIKTRTTFDFYNYGINLIFILFSSVLHCLFLFSFMTLPRSCPRPPCNSSATKAPLVFALTRALLLHM